MVLVTVVPPVLVLLMPMVLVLVVMVASVLARGDGSSGGEANIGNHDNLSTNLVNVNTLPCSPHH